MEVTAETVAAMRGERVVFRNVSFTARAGEAWVLHGANGSGKTTLLRVLSGLLSPMAGHVRYLDEAGRQLLDEARDQSLHFVGHQDSLRPQMRVAEVLGFHAALLGATSKLVIPSLAIWGLKHLGDISAGLLSAGQRRRLSLARLSVQPRKLWLLDEPTTALDAPARAILSEQCNLHIASGGVIIAATHDTFMGDKHVIRLEARA